MIKIAGTDIGSAVEKVHFTRDEVVLTLDNNFDVSLVDAVLFPLFMGDGVVDLHMHRSNVHAALRVSLPEYQPLSGPVGELSVIKIKLKVVAS